MGDRFAVFFDDDVRLGPGVLEAYERDPGRAFFGGPLGCDYEASPPAWLVPLLPGSARGMVSPNSSRPGEYLGFNWAADKADLVAVGGFDPNFGLGSETGARGQESEMQGRLQRAGVATVDVEDAFVRHHVPASRCSPEWAVERMYRSGLGSGTQARRGAGARLIRQGVRTVASQLPCYISARLRRKYPKAIQAKAALAFRIGYLRGYATPADESSFANAWNSAPAGLPPTVLIPARDWPLLLKRLPA